jgi:hypothetical protein
MPGSEDVSTLRRIARTDAPAAGSSLWQMRGDPSRAGGPDVSHARCA